MQAATLEAMTEPAVRVRALDSGDFSACLPTARVAPIAAAVSQARSMEAGPIAAKTRYAAALTEALLRFVQASNTARTNAATLAVVAIYSWDYLSSFQAIEAS